MTPSHLVQRHLAAALLVLAAVAPQAQAALVNRGNGMVYDTVLDITWLADANYARTSGHDADGRMTWAQADAWASGLVYGGFTDWRLPHTGKAGANWVRVVRDDGSTDLGYNIADPRSEMGFMYHVNLGLHGERNVDGTVRSDWGTFGNGTLNGTDTLSFGERDFGIVHNVQAYIYWSQDREPAVNNNLGYNFHTSVGFQSLNFVGAQFHAWAVRDGDVLAVPEPATAALLMLGLGSLVAWGYRRPNRRPAEPLTTRR